MELKGTRELAKPPMKVCAALNNAEVLRRCIPGCEELEKKSDSEMAARVTLKVGPVKASFKGEVTLSDINPPHGYTIAGRVSGGAAGAAKGQAKVSLRKIPQGTELTYEVQAQISGKIAQVGARLVDAAAKKLADEFFDAFVRELGGGADDLDAASAAQAQAAKMAKDQKAGNAVAVAGFLATAFVLLAALYFLAE